MNLKRGGIEVKLLDAQRDKDSSCAGAVAKNDLISILSLILYLCHTAKEAIKTV